MDGKYAQIFQKICKEQEETPGSSAGNRPENGGGIQSCSVRSEISPVEGSDPTGWIYRIEQFFS